MPLDLTQTLSDLVALPSVNPMGRPADGREFFEYRVTDYLERLFTRLELPYERQTVEPKRDNIVARLDGARSAQRRRPAGAVRSPSRHRAGRRHDDRALDAAWCATAGCMAAARATSRGA